MSNILSWINSWTFAGKLSILFFFIFAIFVIWSGIKLVNYSELLILKTKINGIFIGSVFLSFITSIPELITEITQGVVNKPEIGNADDIGSNAFSIFLIAIVSLFFIKEMLKNKLDKWSKFNLVFSFLLTLFLLILMLVNRDVVIGVKDKFVIGIFPFLFFLLYLGFIFAQFYFNKKTIHDNSLEKKADLEVNIKPKKMHFSLKKIVFWFTFWSILIVCFSIFLNLFSDSMKNGYNLSSKSVGGIFLSISTSLPEIIIFLTFVIKKNILVGIASILGSHIFNLAIVFFGDLSYNQDAYFNNPNVAQNWPIVLMCLFMLFIFIIFVFFQKKNQRKGYYSVIGLIFIILIYIIGWILILIL